MIDPKELRIGNCFTGYDNKTFAWSLDEFKLLTSGIDLDEIIKAPIAINPEILERCGLGRSGFNSYDIDMSFSKLQFRVLSISLNEGFIWLREGRSNNREEDDIVVLWNRDRKKDYYFHQLQNLFWCLTGQELELK